MQDMRVLERSGRVPNAKVAYVLISVDGDRDTPAAMKAFLGGFSQQFVGLTEKPERVKSIAKDFSAAFFKESVNTSDGGYEVSHSPQIFVVDVEGKARAEFYNASVDAMVGVVEALLEEAEK